MDNYAKLALANVRRLYANLPDDLEDRLPAERRGTTYSFTAFGRSCALTPDGIYLGGEAAPGVIGVLLSLYALHAVPDAPVVEPLKAFKAFGDAAPYVGAFASHTEGILVPAVDRIKAKRELILERLDGRSAPAAVGGDVAFLVRPLPKIVLGYIFYEADEDFPASATCLYSTNADRFMPIDGLADVGEATSRTILAIVA